MALVAREAGWAIGHALAIVDDKANFTGEVDLEALFLGDASPAFETEGGRRTVWHAPALVRIMLAGGTRRVIPWFCTAPQALWVAALA